MEKYIEIIKLLEKIFGKGSVGRSIGTRTNVVRLPQKEGIDSTTKNYDMNRNLTERPQGYQDIKKDIKALTADVKELEEKKQEVTTTTPKTAKQAKENILNKTNKKKKK